MSDASTTQPLEAADQGALWVPGRGRHRGPVSSHDGEAAPSGRHRKPAEETEAAA
ncbi:hypothetical protein [Streptomyces triticisoli]|jgi:hypothetical protein|uniref:hypothetical protein n=1 Tax=Streptomyces triticisoli TaxID=2182797 RepID=UPI0018E51895|nr:hypothetical protein [Streptomyces triticisoli]